MPQPSPCPRCGGALRFVPSDGPHFGRYDCLSCGRIGAWVKSPWSARRAADFTLPYGKYAGSRVGDLVHSSEGRAYLAWAAGAVKGNMGVAAAVALGLRAPNDGGEAS
jgi:hypothetical protein